MSIVGINRGSRSEQNAEVIRPFAAISSGSWSAARARVLEIAEDGAHYSNDGALAGKPAILISGDDVVFHNSAVGRLTNTAASSTAKTGALVITGSNATVVNEGLILAENGNPNAILGSAFADTVHNSGYVRGYIDLGAGSDQYFETANADTSGFDRLVRLGDGDDRSEFDLSGYGNDFNVVIDGGAGDDVVVFSGLGRRDVIEAYDLGDVERIELTGEAGAHVVLDRHGTGSTATLVLATGLELSVFDNSRDPVFTGKAAGLVLLNGGTLIYDFGAAFDRIVGGDGADHVILQAGPLPPATPATATKSVDLGGGDDTFSFGYGNTAPLAVDGGDGRDELTVSQFDARLDLSVFHGFETIRLSLAIGRTEPFVLTGVSHDAERLLLGGIVRDTSLVLDLGMNDGLTIGVTKQQTVVAAGTTVAALIDRSLIEPSAAASAQRIDNHGTILGDVLLGNGGDRFSSDGQVAGHVAGGAGDDVYQMNTVYKILERAGEGHDRVLSSIDVRLSRNVEEVTLTGSAAISGIGNAGANSITGNRSSNHLAGSNGDDVLAGGAGDDTLVGGNGDDLLIGGIGSDRLTGGKGADVFAFGAADGAGPGGRSDLIADFDGTEGDRIDLSRFAAGPDTSTHEALVFRGDGGFSGEGGEVAFAVVGRDTVLQVDVDGDRISDFDLRLTGHVALTAADFLL